MIGDRVRTHSPAGIAIRWAWHAAADARTWLQSGVYRVVQSGAFMPTVLVLAFAVRVLWVAKIDAQPHSNFAWYFTHAMRIALGQGYSDETGAPTASFPPGYPFFLAVVLKAFEGSWLAGKLTNIILQIAAMYFTYVLGRDLFRSEFAGRVAFLLMAVYPNGIAYTALLANESLFLAVSLGATVALYACLRGSPPWWQVALTGALWGFAVLVKPQAAFFPVLILLLCAVDLWRRGRGRQWLAVGGVTLLVMALMTGAWVYRNYRAFQRPVLTTTMGMYLLMGNCPDTNGQWVDLWGSPNTAALLPPRVGTEYLDDAAAQAAAQQYMRAHPERIVATAPGKLAIQYGGEDGAWWNLMFLRQEHPTVQAFLVRYSEFANRFYLGLQALSLIAVAVFCLQGWLRLRPRAPFPLIGLAIGIYFVLLCIVYFGQPRYHMPVVPWMMIYVAGLVRLAVQPPGRARLGAR